MWWYNKELAPDEMLCGERKTEPGALQVRGTVVWLKNKKGIPSGHYIREDFQNTRLCSAGLGTFPFPPTIVGKQWPLSRLLVMALLPASCI